MIEEWLNLNTVFKEKPGDWRKPKMSLETVDKTFLFEEAAWKKLVNLEGMSGLTENKMSSTTDHVRFSLSMKFISRLSLLEWWTYF